MTSEKFPFGTTSSRIEEISSTSSGEYDPKVAYILAIVSGWAYSDGQTLADKLIYYGFPAGTTVKQMSIVNDALLVVATAYFIRSYDGRVGILAFRGTEPANVINWLMDADTTLRPFHGEGKVHAGFYANVETIWDQVAQEITSALDHPKKGNGHDREAGDALQTLYITGHSLGAAMAVIAAARIFTTDYDSWKPYVRGIYTFGQPLVGDAEFARQCTKRFGGLLYRHVYGYDVVPTLPTRDTGDYTHFGEERFSRSTRDPWSTSPRLRVRQGLWIAPEVLLTFAAFFTRRLRFLHSIEPGFSLDDHSPQRYIDTCRGSLSTP